MALLGSRAFCGEDVATDIAGARGRDGRALADALAGSDFAGRAPARLDRTRHVAFLEAHIEQGPRLERGGQTVGVVSAIVGIRTFRVSFRGQADHAGTTPMDMRRDAGAAALRFGALVGGRLRECGSADTVWNVGSVGFKPGASNVVPSEAELVLQFRDASEDLLTRLEQVLHGAAGECAAAFNAEVEVTRTLATQPAVMDARLADMIARAAAELGAPHLSMPSGAGHDAMVLARYVPAAMMFVPSIGGRSHHVSEDTREEDIVRGAQVLARAVELLLRD